MRIAIITAKVIRAVQGLVRIRFSMLYLT
jgi:hypothetical protein